MWVTRDSLLETIGWLLLNAYWQGMLAWAACLIGRRASRDPAVRSTVANVALLLFLAAQALTFLLIATRQDSRLASFYVTDGQLQQVVSRLAPTKQIAPVPLPYVVGAAPWIALITSWLPFTVVLWAAACIVVAMRGVFGVLALRNLSQRGVDVTVRFEPAIRRLLGRGAGDVRILQTHEIECPAVGGWRKARLFIPADERLRLTHAQTEALVLHELAHVHRADACLHTLREVVRSVYLFQPAIGWICDLADQDAEEAADDLAASVTGDRFAYAETLVTLARRCLPPPKGMLGAIGGSLRRRVRRMVGAPPPAADRSLWNDHRRALGSLFASGLLALVVASYGIAEIAADQRAALWLVDHDVAQNTLATIATEKSNPLAEQALCDAVARVRDGEPLPADLIDRLATAGSGMRSDRLAALARAVPHTNYNVRLGEFGTNSDRDLVVETLVNEAFRETDRERRRTLARAGVTLSTLNVCTDGGIMLERLLRSPVVLQMLELPATDTYRLQLGWALDSQRKGRALRPFTAAFQTSPGPERERRIDRAIALCDHLPMFRIALEGMRR